jgi:hypothetical protein
MRLNLTKFVPCSGWVMKAMNENTSRGHEGETWVTCLVQVVLLGRRDCEEESIHLRTL